MTLHAVPDAASPKAAFALGQTHARFPGLRRRLGGGGQIGAVARVMAFRALTLLMNLATGIVVSASLGPDGRGELAALLLAPQFVGALSLIGLPTAYIYYSKADSAHAGQYFGSALLLSLPVACLAAAVTWTIMPVWLSGHATPTIGMARLLLLSLPFGVLIPLLTGVLDAHGRFGLAGAIQYLQPLGCASLLMPLLMLDSLTPATAAVAYTVPVLLTFGLAAWQAVRLLRPCPTLAAPYCPRLLWYGLRRYGFEVLASLSTYLDQILVVYFLPAAAAGVYAAALSLSRVLGVMQDAVFSVLFPGLAGRPLAEVMTVLGRAVRVSTASAVAAGSVLALLGPEAIALLYGPAFAGAILPFRLLLAATIVLGAARLLGHAFTATGRPGPVTLVEGIGVASTLLAIPLLLPRYGVDGAAAAVLLGSLGRLACTLACLKLVLGMRVPSLIIRRDDLQGMLRR